MIHWLKRKVVRLIDTYMPVRMKRLIVFSSYCALFRSSSDIDPNVLKKLNELLSLCSTQSAMYLPVTLYKVIWNGVQVEDINQVLRDDQALKQVDINELARRLVGRIPTYLRYDLRLMREDAVHLISDKHKVFG